MLFCPWSGFHKLGKAVTAQQSLCLSALSVQCPPAPGGSQQLRRMDTYWGWTGPPKREAAKLMVQSTLGKESQRKEIGIGIYVGHATYLSQGNKGKEQQRWCIGWWASCYPNLQSMHPLSSQNPSCVIAYPPLVSLKEEVPFQPQSNTAPSPSFRQPGESTWQQSHDRKGSLSEWNIYEKYVTIFLMLERNVDTTNHY